RGQRNLADGQLHDFSRQYLLATLWSSLHDRDLYPNRTTGLWDSSRLLLGETNPDRKSVQSQCPPGRTDFSARHILHAPMEAEFENRRIQFSRRFSHQTKNACDVARLLDDAAVLQPPLQGVGDCQIANLWRIFQNFVSQRFRFDIVNRQHPLLKEGENVIAVCLV